MRWIRLLPILAAVPGVASAQSTPMVWSSSSNWSQNFGGGTVIQPTTGYFSDNFGRAGPQPDALSYAQSLIVNGRYGEADVVLTNLIGKRSSTKAKFLKAVSQLGLGNPDVARRYFRGLTGNSSIKVNAMAGLALAEVQLGNRDEARHILGQLDEQKERCGGDCRRASSLDQAISVIRKALI